MYSLEPLDKTVVDSWPVDRAGLPTRAAKALTAAGIATLGELRALDVETLRGLPGLGARTVRQTADFLALCERLTSGGTHSLSLDGVFACFLDPRETRTLERRYALNSPALFPLHRGATLQEIASDLGVTRERVRQMEERALKRLSSLCGRAFLSGLHRLFFDCVMSHRGAVQPKTVAESIDKATTAPYRPAAVLRLLCDCMGGIVFHNGFFAAASKTTLRSVEQEASRYLGEHSTPQPADAVHDAISCGTDLPPHIRDHLLATTLQHAPGIDATLDGRYFLPRTAAGMLAVEVMASDDGEFHYRTVQGRFNALMRDGSRKGTRFILDMLAHECSFERTRPGHYRLRNTSTAGVVSCA